MPKDDNQTKLSRRDSFRKKFSARHPDVNMDDEEAYYGALEDEYNSNNEELSKHRETNKKLNEMFLENPNAAFFMTDLLDGKEQIGISLMRRFGQTFKDAIDDPSEENVKAFADALDENASKIKENDRLQAEFEKNADASEAIIEEWAKSKDMTPDQVDAIREFINTQFGNLLVGIITPEMLDFASKGLSYDKDVAAAEETGAAMGRNEKIKERMKKGKGDGMPMITGNASKRKENPDNGFLASATMEDPWEKAKRMKY